jgi:glycosyltransferase involved in cell wall biosynthesis
MLRDAGHKNAIYLPHGVDTEVFKPMTYDEKCVQRKKFGFPDSDFIISCVAHNQQRKMLARLLRAFKKFSEGKDDVTLFMHTQMKDFTGWDMGQLITDWGLEKKAFLTDKTAKMIGDVHVPPSELRNYYCLSDVHALSSGGEGFGIPMVEAMACGLPNVATDYTTTKEFLCDIKRDPAGKPVGVEPIRGIPVPYVDIEHHYTGGIWALVDTGKMADAFQTLYEDPNLRHKMGTSARQLAVEHYDAKRIKSLWIEVFENAPQFVEELKDSVAEDTGLKAVRFTV